MVFAYSRYNIFVYVYDESLKLSAPETIQAVNVKLNNEDFRFLRLNGHFKIASSFKTNFTQNTIAAGLY